jgi:hypothetical protein
MSESTSRRYVAGGETVEGLRDTRFPFFMVEGQLGSSPFVLGVSYSTYLDRSYHILTDDTISLRGEDVAIADELVSDGGIADLRAALGWDAGQRLQVGVAVHLLAGSTRERVNRVFDHSDYAPLEQSGDVSYSGWGVSAGLVYTPTQRLRLGIAARRDSRLKIRDALLPVFRAQLPTTLTAGFTLIPIPAIRWSVTGNFRTWASARDDVPDDVQLYVFNTWDVGTGIEIRGTVGILRSMPIRVGARYAKQPFSPQPDQPREIGIAGSSGLYFAGRRALFEFAVERVIRDGGGASERTWQLLFGLTLRP